MPSVPQLATVVGLRAYWLDIMKSTAAEYGHRVRTHQVDWLIEPVRLRAVCRCGNCLAIGVLDNYLGLDSLQGPLFALHCTTPNGVRTPALLHALLKSLRLRLVVIETEERP